MKEYSIYETKAKLSAIVEAVIAGEECTISRHGEPVAMIIRYQKPKKKPKFNFLKNKIKLLPGWDEPLSVDELADWGIS